MLPRVRVERGVVAVVVAICAVLMFSIAALAVDLGNAMVRKRDVQSQADFAALAGARGLNGSNTKTAWDPAVIAVAKYLTENLPQNDDPSAASTITPEQLVDGYPNPYPAGTENGEVYFLPDNKLRVISPLTQVDFGLAAVMGFTKATVNAEATVGIRSIRNALPFFAVEGCDYGPQTITDTSNGHTGALNLAAATDDNGATLSQITPGSVALNENPNPGLSIVGTKFKTGSGAVTKVGFFRADGTTFEAVAATPSDDSHITLSAIPANVLAVKDVWYVRVLKGTTWSGVDDAQPLRVGGAVLECVGASNEGNFGTLKFPRLDVNNAASGGWLPINIARGLQKPMSIGVYPGTPPPDLCTTASQPPAIISTATVGGLKEGTNCVETDTGLTDVSATAGFITGGQLSDGTPVVGRLVKDTTPGCGRDAANPNARWTTPIKTGPGNTYYTINDDILTCFFNDTTTSIEDVSVETYTGQPVIDADIYKSPRFFTVPVLGVDPSGGTSDKYTIIDVRAGFITDQPKRATGADDAECTPATDSFCSHHNGLSFANGKVNVVKVVFFNFDAIEPPGDSIETAPYIGTGPKIIRLLD